MLGLCLIFAKELQKAIQLAMAKLTKNPNSTTGVGENRALLPLQGYMSTIKSRDERITLKHSIMEAMRVHSDASFWRFVVGRTNRPSYAQREAVAVVIRHHSGNETYTGEDLFPEHLYN